MPFREMTTKPAGSNRHFTAILVVVGILAYSVSYFW